MIGTKLRANLWYLVRRLRWKGSSSKSTQEEGIEAQTIDQFAEFCFLFRLVISFLCCSSGELVYIDLEQKGGGGGKYHR